MTALLLAAILLQGTAANVSCTAMPDMLALERARSVAIAAHDAGWLERLYSDDFTGLTSAGADVGKPQLLALFARVDSSTDFAPEAVEGVPLGADAAVSRGLLVGRRSGTVVSRARFLHVYRKFGCEWRMVTGVAVPVPAG
jgi:hypothetical protein